MKLSIVIVVIVTLMGCASLRVPTPQKGTYKTILTVKVSDSCRQYEGYFIGGKGESTICIRTNSWFYDWDHIATHEAQHMFRHLFNLPQDID